MSNYFELISNVSLVKLGKSPSEFTDITKRRYNKIKEGISNALNEMFLSREFKFRERKLSIKTISGLNKYVNNYGYITDIYCNKQKLTYNKNIDNNVVLNDTLTGTPTTYIIYGNCIILHPIPDAVYTLTILTETDKAVKQVNVVDAESASNQTNLYLSSTTGLEAGDILTINKDTLTEESVVISSVVTDDYVVLEDNLIYTHSINENVEKYKSVLEYETDEPNFPDLYHKSIEYHALRQLYMNNQAKLAKYELLYNNSIKNLVVNDRGSINNKPRFVFRY